MLHKDDTEYEPTRSFFQFQLFCCTSAVFTIEKDFVFDELGMIKNAHAFNGNVMWSNIIPLKTLQQSLNALKHSNVIVR